MLLRKTVIFSLALASAAPTGLMAQTPAPVAQPSEGATAPPPPVEPPPEKKPDGAVETIGGAVGGVLGSAAGAAGGPVGSAAAGLVGKNIGRNTASFVKRVLGGKKDKDEPKLLQVAAPQAPAAQQSAVEAAATAADPSPHAVGPTPVLDVPPPASADLEVPPPEAVGLTPGAPPVVSPLAEPAPDVDAGPPPVAIMKP